MIQRIFKFQKEEIFEDERTGIKYVNSCYLNNDDICQKLTSLIEEGKHIDAVFVRDNELVVVYTIPNVFSLPKP